MSCAVNTFTRTRTGPGIGSAGKPLSLHRLEEWRFLYREIANSSLLKRKRVQVFWPEDNKWHEVGVKEFSSLTDEVVFSYRTGELERLRVAEVIEGQICRVSASESEHPDLWLDANGNQIPEGVVRCWGTWLQGRVVLMSSWGTGHDNHDAWNDNGDAHSW